MSVALLAAQSLSSGYGGAPVLQDVSLSVQPGETLVVLGKNGMGKTTLLKTLMGFLKVSKGRITLAGEDVTGCPPHAMAPRGVAYAPQDYTLFQDLTVEENLRLGVQDDATFRERVDALREAFPRMLERMKQRAGTLSGGEQKMLIMSRALLSRPRLMLVDEISEGLQPSMIDRVSEVLKTARKREGMAILLVEQHLAFALSIADRYAILKLGRMVEEGSARDAADVAEHLSV